MSSDAYANSINDVLNAYLHQVTGSTAESLRDMVKKAGLPGNPALASKFTIVCIFAAAVNKATVESLIATNDLADVRGLIGSAFSIQGKPNMSALSLLGHAMLTSKFCDKINFAQKFREKIGQSNIWDRDLNKDRLSDKQHEIFNQKKKNNDARAATLLGNGYFKVTGMEATQLSDDESIFWGVAPSSAATGSVGAAGSSILPTATQGQPPAAPSRSRNSRAKQSVSSQQVLSPPPQVAGPSSSVTMPPRSEERVPPAFAPSGETVTYGSQQSATISASALEYFRTCISDNPDALAHTIAKNGPEKFEQSMAKARADDPNMTRRPDPSRLTSLGF